MEEDADAAVGGASSDGVDFVGGEGEDALGVGFGGEGEGV